MRKIYYISLLLTLLISNFAYAAATADKKIEPTKVATTSKQNSNSKEKKSSNESSNEEKESSIGPHTKGIKFSGYIDGSYNYLLRSNEFISGVPDRLNDIEENGFTLHQAAFTVTNNPKEGLGFLVNAFVGRDAFILVPYGFDPDTGIHNLGYDVLQAFLQYNTGNLSILAGQLLSITGFEQVDPTDEIADTNFSRSNLGYGIPGTVLGLRAIYTINNLILTGGVNNGWDSIRDTSRQKTIEWGLTYNLGDNGSLGSLALQGYSGEQRIEDKTSTGPTGRRSIIDFIAIINATQKLRLVTECYSAMQTKSLLPEDVIGRARWQGIAGYINYRFNEQWGISFRAEDFDDINGYRTGVAQNWKEATLTLGYIPIKNMEIHLETRRDFSNVNSFLTKNKTAVRNNQQSFGVEASYKF